MTTHALERESGTAVHVWHGLSVHWVWLAGGFAVAFAVPYLLADVLEIDRDLLSTGSTPSRSSACSRRGADRPATTSSPHRSGTGSRRLCLGSPQRAVLAAMVVRTEDATSRPDGLELIGARAAIAFAGVPPVR